MCKALNQHMRQIMAKMSVTLENNPLGLQTKPQTFLKKEKGFVKVHQEIEAECNRSLYQVLQSIHHGLKDLGYSNERHTLASWYRVYK